MAYLARGWRVVAPELPHSIALPESGPPDQVTFSGHTRAAMAVWDWLARTWPDAPRALAGHSIGAYAIAHLAAAAPDTHHLLAVSPPLSGNVLLNARKAMGPAAIEAVAREAPLFLAEMPVADAAPALARVAAPVAVVTGAGPIGMMVALAALAGGCARVIVADLAQPKLDIIGAYDGIETVNIRNRPLAEAVAEATDGWGADVVFECSGAAPAILGMAAHARPGGAIVLVGMPVDPVPVDIVALQAKELRVETVFRYANVYDRAIALIASGKVDLKPLISASIPFADSIAGFDRAVEARDTDVKLQIVMPA